MHPCIYPADRWVKEDEQGPTVTGRARELPVEFLGPCPRDLAGHGLRASGSFSGKP